MSIGLAAGLPLKIDSWHFKEITATKTEAIFTFRADFSLTEDLCKSVSIPDFDKLQAAIRRLDQAGQKQAALSGSQIIAELNAAGPYVVKVVNPIGEKGVYTGKVRARLNEDGSWDYDPIEASDFKFEGNRRPANETWLIEGTREANERQDIIRKQIAAFVTNADQIIAEAEEQRKNAEAEAQRQEEAFLASFSEGMEIIGHWQGKQSRGDIGMRFGGRTKMGDGYSLDGLLFDPANKSRTKPFVGKTRSKGTGESPYVIVFHVKEKYPIDEPDSLYRQVLDKTAGFLLQRSEYGAALTFNPNDGSLSGLIDQGNIFSPHISGGFNGDKIPLQFTEGYVPTPSPPEPEPTPPVPSAGKSDGFPEPEVNPATGRKYRMSREEMNYQRRAILPFYDDFREAMRRHDKPALLKALDDMKAQFPNCPTTLYSEMLIAGMQRDKAKVESLYKDLTTEYPLEDSYKELCTDSYRVSLENATKPSQ